MNQRLGVPEAVGAAPLRHYLERQHKIIDVTDEQVASCRRRILLSGVTDVFDVAPSS